MFACTVYTCTCTYLITALLLYVMCSKLKEFSPAVEMNAQTIVSVRPTLLVLLWLSCALVSLTVAQGTNDKLCDQPTGTTSTCMCQTESNQLIDLTPLAKNDKTAKYVQPYHNVF